MSDVPRVLFLCTANACRSQMAEGWTRHVHGDALDVMSAGTRATQLNRRAAKVMAEAGVDISRQESKSVDDLAPVPFDLVVTVCDDAAESCPVPPDARSTVHRPFDDPPRLAAGLQTEEAILEPYRRVRDEIRAFVERDLPDLLRMG